MKMPRKPETLLRGSRAAAVLNHRQIALIGHMLKHPEARYDIKGHRRSHNVTYETARTDLATLDKQGFLESYTQGRKLMYRTRSNFEKRLKRIADS